MRRRSNTQNLDEWRALVNELVDEGFPKSAFKVTGSGWKSKSGRIVHAAKNCYKIRESSKFRLKESLYDWDHLDDKDVCSQCFYRVIRENTTARKNAKAAEWALSFEKNLQLFDNGDTKALATLNDLTAEREEVIKTAIAADKALEVAVPAVQERLDAAFRRSQQWHATEQGQRLTAERRKIAVTSGLLAQFREKSFGFPASQEMVSNLEKLVTPKTLKTLLDTFATGSVSNKGDLTDTATQALSGVQLNREESYKDVAHQDWFLAPNVNWDELLDQMCQLEEAGCPNPSVAKALEECWRSKTRTAASSLVESLARELEAALETNLQSPDVVVAFVQYDKDYEKLKGALNVANYFECYSAALAITGRRVPFRMRYARAVVIDTAVADGIPVAGTKVLGDGLGRWCQTAPMPVEAAKSVQESAVALVATAFEEIGSHESEEKLLANALEIAVAIG